LFKWLKSQYKVFLVCQLKCFTTVSIAKNVSLLQQRGPPRLAIEIKLSAVILLDIFHSPFDRGVALVIRLIKMPVPTAAPQAP